MRKTRITDFGRPRPARPAWRPRPPARSDSRRRQADAQQARVADLQELAPRDRQRRPGAAEHRGHGRSPSVLFWGGTIRAGEVQVPFCRAGGGFAGYPSTSRPALHAPAPIVKLIPWESERPLLSKLIEMSKYLYFLAGFTLAGSWLGAAVPADPSGVRSSPGREVEFGRDIEPILTRAAPRATVPTSSAAGCGWTGRPLPCRGAIRAR